MLGCCQGHVLLPVVKSQALVCVRLDNQAGNLNASLMLPLKQSGRDAVVSDSRLCAGMFT